MDIQPETREGGFPGHYNINNRQQDTYDIIRKVPQSLPIYIPPHSAHPPGVLTGLVIGNCHRIHSLCSDPDDKHTLLKQFFSRLRARGYASDTLAPLFHRAHLLSLATPPPSINIDPIDESEEKMKRRIFFHLEYHPDSPKSPLLQEAWKNTVMQPSSGVHLSYVQNNHGYDVELQQMTVAYSRPRNIDNLLSPRTLHLTTGPPVSSYRKWYKRGPQREREFLATPFSGLLPPSFRLTYRHIYYFILFIFVQGVHRTTPTPRAYIIFHAHKICLYRAKYIRHVPILVWSCNRSIYTCFYIYLLTTRHILVF